MLEVIEDMILNGLKLEIRRGFIMLLGLSFNSEIFFNSL
jgi:hypothetical protein